MLWCSLAGIEGKINAGGEKISSSHPEKAPLLPLHLQCAGKVVVQRSTLQCSVQKKTNPTPIPPPKGVTLHNATGKSSGSLLHEPALLTVGVLAMLSLSVLESPAPYC